MESTTDWFYVSAQNIRHVEVSAISTMVHHCQWCFSNLSFQLGNSTNFQHHFSTVDDSQGRFSVWANNIGALKDPKSTSSLDYRLRDGIQMRKNILQAMKDMKESAERASSIVAGTYPNRNNETNEAFMNASKDDSSTGAAQINPLLAGTQSSVNETVTSELDELLSSIQDSVDRLFRLSMLIRRSRPQGRLPTDTRAPEADPTMDIRHVKDKFPKVKETEWLAERIGTAIAKRRAFIYYRQLHRQRLAEQSRDVAEDGRARSKRVPSTIATTYDEGSIDIEQQVAKLGRVSIITGATSFATALGADDNGDLRIPDLAGLKYHGTQLKYDSAFECPFCRTIQLVSTEREWRKHVFTDLQPYVCTFEDCSSSPFSSRHEWFNHELEAHRKQWHCTKCHNSKFTSESNLRDHFDLMHPGSFTDAQWPLILRTCQRPLRNFGSCSCPLCFSWSPPESKAYNADEFCRHLGSHLQQLALAALPITIEGLVILDDGDHGDDDDKDAVSDPTDDKEDTGENPGSDAPALFIELQVLSVGVPRVEFDRETRVYVFIVEAYSEAEVWELRRRYEDFYDLQVNLLAVFPREAGNMGDERTLPLMTGPVSQVTKSISEARQVSLDKYLRSLIRQPEYISRSSIVARFFAPRESDGIVQYRPI